MKFLVTGGAGFIGSEVVKQLIGMDEEVINVDKLTYASCIKSLEEISSSQNYKFYKEDICSFEKMSEIIFSEEPDAIMHLAAESHVDNSITDPDVFIKTNIFGTYNLLNASKKFFNETRPDKFLFHHVSTDEVYGDLNSFDTPFKETNPYLPSSPYSASKASSDHLVKAWGRTYGLPTIISNCSNNFGHFQNVEKLIPKTITNAIKGIEIPIYGKGHQIRDWLFVEDHARSSYHVSKSKNYGESYNIGTRNEVRNIDLVKMICQILDELVNEKPNNISSFLELITFVDDRLAMIRDMQLILQNLKKILILSLKKISNLILLQLLSGILKTIIN